MNHIIDRTSLKGYGEQDGRAVVTFVDGFELQMVPEWKNDSVRRIYEIYLLHHGEICAQIVKGCFETRGEIDQRTLGAYCRFAIDLERDVYRLYRMGKIEEREWQKRFRKFWKIVIKSRQIADTLALAQYPSRDFMMG